MIEFLLEKELNRRILKEVGANDYFHETVSVRVKEPNTTINLDNSIYFLISKSLDIPDTAKVILNSPDSFYSFSKIEFENYQGYGNQSFRNKLRVKTMNYGIDFTPFTLEFLKVTPIIND